MELVLLVGLLMLWLAVAFGIAVLVGGAIRLRDDPRTRRSAAQGPEEVLHVVV